MDGERKERFPRLRRVFFKSEEDDARAWRIAAWQKPTVGTADGGMVADVEQLQGLHEANIPVFVRSKDGDLVRLDIDRLEPRKDPETSSG